MRTRIGLAVLAGLAFLTVAETAQAQLLRGRLRSPFSRSYEPAPGYVMAGRTTTTIRSFYSGPERPADDQAMIVVQVPTSDCDVWFEETMTKQKGMERTFTSPSLEKGKTFTYKVKAKWMENGREVTAERSVDVKPGEDTVVTFGEQPRRRGLLGLRERRTREPVVISEPVHAGKVVRVERDMLIMTDGRVEHRHPLASNATIMIDGKEAKMADLKPGMTIDVTTTGRTMTATKIVAKTSK